MRVRVVTPPAPVVTWEEADTHLKLDRDESQRTEVEAFVAAATAHLDGPDGVLGRALGDQVLECRFPAFGTCGWLALPCPPAIEMVSVQYVDDAGSTITLDASAYELGGNMLRPAWPNPFPQAAWRGAGGDVVRVQYRAGYETLPAPIRSAILLMVGDLHRFRATASDISTATTSIPMSLTVERLLQPYRVYT